MWEGQAVLRPYEVMGEISTRLSGLMCVEFPLRRWYELTGQA